MRNTTGRETEAAFIPSHTPGPDETLAEPHEIHPQDLFPRSASLNPHELQLILPYFSSILIGLRGAILELNWGKVERSGG